MLTQRIVWHYQGESTLKIAKGAQDASYALLVEQVLSGHQSL
ncbi:unnamed protein product [marine sediment metagenome]|uniref:Uncharacterized protein n=1 Tax=marine sediment metagenome TaxID=412755 RepID=X1R3N3_9ZZZZ